nr:ATPase associated with various cellular activities domain containing protein [Haemonchus contortus]
MTFCLVGPQRMVCVRALSTLHRRLLSVDVEKTVLKLGSLRVPIKETTRPELVPARYGVHEVKVPDEALSHLKWLLQKEILGQDVFLIGVPGALRSDIVLQYLELCNREYEYLAITRDTTESDIKQRREIRSGTAFYTDLCAVRAALHGRILVIDGVEKAERNVLPILNNLLENREMQLDDGRFLMRPDKYDKLIGNYTINDLREMGIERVSERFHVIALGLPVPRFHGNSLDPPLRSRFQCRNIAEPSFEAVRQLCTTLAPNVNSNSINDLLSLLYAINSQPDLGLSLVPLEKAERIMRIWNINPSYSPESMFNLMYPYRSMFKEHHIKVTEEFLEKFISERSKSSEPAASITRVSPSDKGTSTTVEVSFDHSGKKRTFSTEVSGKPSSEDRSFVSTPSQEALLADLAVAHSQGDFALLGAKGTGKTKLIAELAGRLGFNTDTMILYQDMNARELLQRRRMLDNGDTLWEDSQLVAAAKRGDVCVLDGAERVHWSALESLASLCYHRTLFLPDGSRLVGSDEFDNIQKKTGNDEEHLNSRGVFRIPKSFRLVLIGSSSLTENKWLNETVISLMPFFTMQKLSIDDQCKILQGLVPAEASETTRKLIEFVDKLQSSGDASLRGVAESLSIRKLIHIAKRDCLHPGELRDLIEKAALARFLPSVTRLAFHTELDKAGFVKNPSSTDELSDDLKYLLDKNAVEDKKETMIPDVLFYENDQHMSVIRDMARDMRLGAHLLLIGNQGVGKNKITDRFLHLIQRPRQYMQLHRDTTVESITMQTTVENGILRYEDSALVRAARAGHVLVIDEADKAPLHVIAILKSLLDSGTLLLGDGRRIQPASAPPCDRSIPLHPDFRIIMLANRPGFPFLGNDLFGLLGDLFSVHTVDNPDRESELEMLKKYAPDVEDGTLLKLMAAFTELREMADEGLLQYPYSTRELVNIVKHVNQFPNDSLSTVIRNVFDFDAFTSDAIATIQTVFQKHGIPFGVKRPREHVFVSHRFPIERPSSIGEWGAVDNVVPIDVKTSVVSINAKAQPLKAKSLKLIKEYVRTQQFTEQECAWQIPMLDVNICSDGLVMGNSLIVATVNPTRIYAVKDLYLTDEVFEIDVSSMLSHHNLLKYEPRIRLAQYGEGSFLVHEEVSGSILLVNLNRNTIQRIELGESALSNFANRFLKSERRLIQGGCPLLYTREGNQISRFEPGGTITQMTLGGEISKVFPVGSDKILVKMKNGSYDLLCHESGHWKARPVRADFANSLDIDSLRIQNDAVFLAAEGYHFLKSSGFPLLLSATDVIGSVRPTPANVVDGRRPYYLSDDVVKKFIDPYRNLIALRDGVVIRAQPKWKVPKDAAGEGKVNVHEIGGFLEAVNADNGFVQYIPVPEPRYHSYHGPWCATISHTPFIIVPYNDERMLTIDTCGGVRSYELSPNTLGRAFFEWNRLVGGEDDHKLRLEFERESDAFDLSKLDDPQVGKFDPENTPHHGGNQWMGGTGGYSTAGLGGVGGPFRLDAGHDVHQMPDSIKKQVPDYVLKKAREVAKAEYQKRLKEIAMSEYDADAYMTFWNKIEKHSNHLRSIIEQLEAKKKERQWARHQTSGDLDDGKLIEGITGERNIYRRRLDKRPEPGAPQLKPKRMQLCFDVSGSMYRFNGYDKRLQKSLEVALMVMTSFEGKQEKVAYDITGHSGDGPCIEFVTDGEYPKNNKERLDILKQMVAHSQFCTNGDYTLESLDEAIKTLSKEKDCDERIVVLISDANLDRYGISPKDFVKIMNKDDTVSSFVILIGSLGHQAQRIQAALPVGKAYVCENTSDLPKIMQNIFASTLR